MFDFYKICTVCLIAALLLGAVAGQAQVSYGLKAGAAYSHIEIVDLGENFFGDLIDPKMPVFGYLIEFAAGGHLTDWLEFRSGINLSLKGEQEWQQDFNIQPDLRFQYVGVPFYASWQVCKGWS
ncbi:MAG: hypothetical protein KDC44_16590, partial [Phaeodactylibacter sp.]|nr:hypothetical protein [Phaeodactylibacter sp.]